MKKKREEVKFEYFNGAFKRNRFIKVLRRWYAFRGLRKLKEDTQHLCNNSTTLSAVTVREKMDEKRGNKGKKRIKKKRNNNDG